MIRNNFVLATIVLSTLLSACSGLQDTGVYNKPDSTAESITVDRQIADLLQRATQQTEPDASISTMRAVDLLIDNSQLVRAKTVFARVQQKGLTGNWASEYHILSAVFAKQDSNVSGVMSALQQIPDSSNPMLANNQQRSEIGRLKAWAYLQQGQSLASAKQLIAIDSMLEDELDLTENREAIWLVLSALSDEQQKTAMADPETDLRGWMALVSLYQTNQGDVFELRRQLSRWRTNWSDHPAAKTMPTELASAMALDEDIPQRVTLMLPTSGKLATAGAAVRDGFLAAYYDSQQAGGMMELNLIDTNAHQSFSDAYAAALQQQPDMIVGPLRKPEIAALRHLVAEDGPRILALNYAEDNANDEQQESPAGFFQFGLAAGDEANQIATMLLGNQPQRALLIRPTGAWGQRVADSFKQPWLENGSIVLDEVSYSKGDNLSELLKQALLVDQSEFRKNRAQALLEEQLEFIPRRRKDIDLFFLIARPEQARSLKPILAFHYAGDVPVYSTSQVFAGLVRRHRDRDLNGIVFTETPWLLGHNSDLRQRINELLPTKSSYARMQAFGVDAFGLAIRLGFLSRSPNSAYSGATGRLSLGDNMRIRRELDLAQFVAGKPRKIEFLQNDNESETQGGTGL
ncbi:MAG: penicillin-binding protein activator [Pseudomonadales bacterium]